VRPDALLLDAEIDEGFAVLSAARRALPGAALLRPLSHPVRQNAGRWPGQCHWRPR
jgi:hypothetical protein